MKRIGLIPAVILLMALPMFSQTVSIPDTAFLYALIEEGVDTDKDSLISYSEAEAAIFLDFSCLDNCGGWIPCCCGTISSLVGIEAFKNLESLNCMCNPIESLDLSNNTALTYLDCSENRLTSLDVSNTSLIELQCENNQLTSLDVSNNTALIELQCENNQLTSLDVSNNTALIELQCENNQLTSLDISNTSIKEFGYYSGKLNQLRVNNCRFLKYLACVNSQLNSLDLSSCDSLESLRCEDNQLTELDLSECKLLRNLKCHNNSLVNLNLTKNSSLFQVYCRNNLLNNLDVSNISTLHQVHCDHNKITHLDFFSNTSLFQLNCSNNLLTSLIVSETTDSLICNNNYLTILDISKNTELFTLDISNMTTLQEVCVWTMPFPPDGLYLGITGSNNVYFTTDCTFGFREYDQEGLSIYPNPANEILTIETDNSDHYSIRINSLNGQLILSKEMEGTTHQLDFSSFQKGIYFITVKSKDFVTTRKIIKL